jgi:uncharacterized protein (TIGR02145 family)
MLGYAQSRVFKPKPKKCVKIGDQCWMIKNLDIDDGDGGIYAYNDDENNVETYGRLYTWGAAIRVASNVDGWHLPSYDEWVELFNYLSTNGGGKLKEEGTTHWLTPNTGATNESGFTALPAGYRSAAGVYDLLGGYTYYWAALESSATNAWCYFLIYNSSSLSATTPLKANAFSVRLIKDE